MSIKQYTKGSAIKLSENFYSYEFDCKCSNSSCKITYIDEELVGFLQLIRTYFGKPLHINSAYRCTKHNAAVGGGSKSKHKDGMACDFWVEDTTPAEICAYAQSIGVLGIGIYDNFVHIDTRNYKAFWRGHEQAYVSTFIKATANKDGAQQLQTIRWGMKNSDVKLLQERLIALGYDLGTWGADGHFGTKTYTAVCKFQRDNGLTVDGICGQQTWSALLK